MANSGRLELGDNIYGYYKSIFNHSDVTASKANSVKNAKRTITPFKVIQDHQGQYQSKACMRLPISD